MTTATGDIVYDFSGIADTNPYVPAGFSAILGTGQILTGDLRSNTAGTAYRILYDGVTANADITRATIEVGFGNAAMPDDTIAMRLVTADQQNGYAYSVRSNTSFYRVITAGSFTGTTNPATSGFVTGDTFSLEYQKTTGRVEIFKNGVSLFSTTDNTHSGELLTWLVAIEPGTGSTAGGVLSIASTGLTAGADYTQRKGSTFDVAHTLGTITTATLNAVNVFDRVSSQAAGTVSFTGAVTDEITTSGVVNLVLGDGTGTETYTVQVNVYGVVPSNNPAQRDGAALASLTGVQVRITNGTSLNGVQRFYSATETTDASGNFSTYDVSSSVAAAADPVLMTVLTSAGDSITSTETVELI